MMKIPETELRFRDFFIVKSAARLRQFAASLRSLQNPFSKELLSQQMVVPKMGNCERSAAICLDFW